ncbi:MAG: hypothetical protein NTX24_00870 [Candidatus Pacearchaeota archaeon]|nr:hypothetical protein [Candidatus Pacearchaeota archaeon]
MSKIIVTNGNREINIDHNTSEGRRNLLLHEVGHWAVAKYLGYTPLKLVFDIKDERFYIDTPLNPKNRAISRTETLEENIEISLGGKVAEDLCGFQTAGFLAGDLVHIYGFLQQLHQTRGATLPFEKIGDLLRDYERHLGRYEERTRQILQEMGGQEPLEGTTDYLLKTYIEPGIADPQNRRGTCLTWD